MSLALIRTLGEKGIRIVCCEYERETYPLGFYSRHCRERYTLPDEGGMDALYRICEKFCRRDGEKPLLFPVGAKTLLALSKKEESLRFKQAARFFIPSEEQLNRFNDKKIVAEIARKNGVPVPEEYVAFFVDDSSIDDSGKAISGDSESHEPSCIGEGDSIKQRGCEGDCAERRIPEGIIFPCIVKPACGEKFGLSAAKRYYIAGNCQELEKYWKMFRETTGEEPIVQKYLSGAGAGCSVLCLDGEIVSAVCHRRLREYPVTGGPSTCCRSFYSDELMNYAKKMVAAVGYNGIAMIEFKYDGEGRAYLLEINPRIWGTFPLVRVASSDFIDKWVELALSCSEESANTAGRTVSGYCASERSASHRMADFEETEETDIAEKNVLGASARNHFRKERHIAVKGSDIFDVGMIHRPNYQEKKMIYGFSDLIGAMGYAKRGRFGKSFGAVIDFLNPFIADGLWEWTDIRPGIMYLKSVLKRKR